MKKSLITFLVFLLVFSLGVGSGVMARDGSAKIDVMYRNIKLMVNGVNVPATGENEPFIYGGRTFVPLRLVSEALGYNVNWDSSTFTVIIGDSTGPAPAPAPAPAGQKLIDVLPPYHVSHYYVSYFPTTQAGSIKLGGTEYKNSLSIRRLHTTDWASFNLAGKYTSLTGIIGTLATAWNDCMVNIYADGRVIKTFEIKVGALPQNFALDVSGVRELKIERVAQGGDIGLAELIIK